MKMFLGQINPTVGALEANYELIREVYEQGVRAGADLVLVPELAITGYPPRDLLDKKVFVDRNRVATVWSGWLHEEKQALVFGCVTWNEGRRQALPQHRRRRLTGALSLWSSTKRFLPTYDVFDGLRYFEPRFEQQVIELCGRSWAC